MKILKDEHELIDIARPYLKETRWVILDDRETDKKVYVANVEGILPVLKVLDEEDLGEMARLHGGENMLMIKADITMNLIDKNNFSKEETIQLGFDTIPNLNKAMEQGYFTRTTLRRNKIEINYDGDFKVAYSGLSKRFVKVYKNYEAYKLYKTKKIKWS